MTRFRTLIAGAFLVLAASPALAQTAAKPRPAYWLATETPLAIDTEAGKASPAAAGVTAAATQRADRPRRISLVGGLITGYGDAGFAVGGGIGLLPFDNERVELAIDALYGHTSQTFSAVGYSTSVLGFSGSVLYLFETADESFRPFAGGGLLISHASLEASVLDEFAGAVSGTFAAIQLVGGIEKPLSEKRAFRAELRAGAAGFGGSLVLLAGVSFR